MKKLSLIFCALIFSVISAYADGTETLCFSGKMGGKISVIIAFDYHIDNEERPSGYIYYPNAKNPAPILIVGNYMEEDNAFFFNEYQPDGTISGTLFFKVDGFEYADGPYIAEGEWKNPKTGKPREIFTGNPAIGRPERSRAYTRLSPRKTTSG